MANVYPLCSEVTDRDQRKKIGNAAQREFSTTAKPHFASTIDRNLIVRENANLRLFSQKDNLPSTGDGFSFRNSSVCHA